MIKIRLQQKQQQKFTPQQIQLINMLQHSQAQLEDKINEELTENPALEEEKESSEKEEIHTQVQENIHPSFGYKIHDSNHYEFIQNQLDNPLSDREELLEQFYFLQLGSQANLIAEHLIGSLTAQGYLPYASDEIAEEISILHHKKISRQQVNDVLEQLKKIAPPGFAAQDLRMCLLAQLQGKKPTQRIHCAIEILTQHYETFTKKHYDKIANSLSISHDTLKKVIQEISSLNPMPMPVSGTEETTLTPNFDVEILQGRITVIMIEKKKRKLMISPSYQNLMKTYKTHSDPHSQKVVAFVQDKINRAKWFIQALEKRRKTLLKIIETIVLLQKPFFETGDETTLKPIFLKNVAKQIDMDISTVSRAIHQKAVQTNGQVYPLKYFFSEAIPTTDGKEISSRVVKKVLQEIINTENKQQPYRDVDLVALLKQKKILLARRTVAKYREQLGLPVARLRKEIA